ncbi:hypothetical protein NZK35_25205 [Stieleria sp. ICT_E10.1]|uniref:hypothetical protein n=1 Tax=Stieleria sedimenti TaxID=2976331 RepID=UPI0021800EF2|nr:hypothetical protein [Stieleria sedimenti]MCS7469963.1 hypothetical protein [Stieleria sedimenti]
MNRISLFTLCFAVAAFAAFFAIVVMGARQPDSIAGWLVESLGWFYGVTIYGTGSFALLVAIAQLRRSCSPASTACLIPLAFIPAFVGVIGLLHNYIYMNRLIASSPSYPKHDALAYGHAFGLTPLLVGMCFTTVAFAILSFSLLHRSLKDEREPT